MEERIDRGKWIRMTLHVLSAAILACSLLFSFFHFKGVFFRVTQAIEDCIRAAAYFIGKPFNIDFLSNVRQTVNDVPESAIEILPFDPAILKGKFKLYFKVLFSKENLLDFSWFLFSVFGTVIKLFAPVLLLLYLIKKRVLAVAKKLHPEGRNEDTVYLKWFKICERATWRHFKEGCIIYVCFLKEHKAYIIAFLAIWTYNLNLFTIAIEAIAFAMHLITSLNGETIFVQIAKLAMDGSVAISFLPPWAIGILVWLAFDYIRTKTGMVLLWNMEEYDEAFLKEHPGALYVIARQRMKKTTTITAMARTEERVHREHALEDMLRCEKNFPFFPWINVDHLYKVGMEKDIIHVIAQYEPLIKRLRLHFKYRHRYETKERKFLKDFLFYWYKKKCGYDFNDFIFGYEHKYYPTKYNNGLVMVDVFEAVQDYIEQLHIYAAPTPLIFGNYSIRTDIQFDRSKVFPKMDANYFSRRPQDLYAVSQYCHISDQDAQRLGKLIDENNPYKDGFEVGIEAMTEYAKERGNQLTNRGVSAEDEDANVKNDNYEMNVKMQTHGATIANYTYVRRFMDDHRAGSLGADNRDLCTVVYIKKCGPRKCVLPFSGIEKTLGWVAGKLYDKAHLEEKYNHADHTLTMYLMRKIFTPIFHYVDRRLSTFSYCVLKLKVTDGADSELLDGDKFYIIEKKDYAGAFATDTFKDYYRKKARRSKYGLNDFPQYKGRRMTTEEMDKVHSYLFKRMNEVFSGDQT